MNRDPDGFTGAATGLRGVTVGGCWRPGATGLVSFGGFLGHDFDGPKCLFAGHIRATAPRRVGRESRSRWKGSGEFLGVLRGFGFGEDPGWDAKSHAVLESF